MKTKNLLVDTKPIRLTLIEGDEDGKVRVRGEFARAGHATENKRVYPKKVWEKEISRLEAAMKGRSVFGEMDHPVDGRTSLNRVSHIVTGLNLEDGVLVGEAEIMPTDKGRNLMALLKSGCRVGVSSRGYGSTKPNDKGEEIVQEDYRLVTFDFVADPADQNAYPEAFFEGVEFPMLTRDQEKQKAKDWAARIQAAAEAEESGVDKTKLADEMLSALASMKDEVREEIRGELLSDPTVAGSRTAIEQIVNILRPFTLSEDAETLVKAKDAEIGRLKKEISERDLQIKDLEGENSKLAEAAKEAGYKLYLERQLADDPDAALIKKIVGDVKQYTNAEALKTKLSGVREELSKKRAEERKVEESKVREVARTRELARKVNAEYEEKIDTLSEAVEKLTQANKALSIRYYAENKLRNNPRSAKIRSLIEKANPTSKEEVDSIIEDYAPAPPKDDDEAAGVRARIRRFTRGGLEGDPADEETPRRPPLSEDYNGLGVNLVELKRLSGTRK
jgi:hypothetical protein